MNNENFTANQYRRYLATQELAQKKCNLTMFCAEPHLNPYRDIPPFRLKMIESVVKEALLDSLPSEGTLVLLEADEKISSTVSLDFAKREKAKGRVIKLKTHDKKWFENNWQVFAGDYGLRSSRSIFVFFPLCETTVSRLTSPWWDPDVLTNPEVANSRTLLNQVKDEVKPGVFALSLSLVRLCSCQLYFHPTDVECIAKTVCISANKTKWWKLDK